jgi:hypothetical protein
LPGSCLAYEPQAGVVSGAEMASCLVFILTWVWVAFIFLTIWVYSSRAWVWYFWY